MTHHLVTPADPGRPQGRFGVKGATHAFGGVMVLKDVDFELRRGTVHGLLGQNGAGKSTLIKILTGALNPLRGEITIDGEQVKLVSPAHAQRLGVGVVHQDVQLFPLLNVATNVFAFSRRLPRRRLSRRIHWRAVEETVEAQLNRLGIDIDPRTRVESLSLAEQKLVEIAKAMLLEPRYLILDEPTASLEPRAAGRVLSLLERLRSDGVGLCFVSHRLHEVRRIADEMTVLRDGQVAGYLPAGASEKEIVDLMFGAGLEVASERRPSAATPTVALQISGLRLPDGRRPVDLALHAGEVLGLTGLLGSGAEAVVRMIGGAQRAEGSVRVFGNTVDIRAPRDAMKAGIGFIPGDRKRAGLVPEQTVAVNVSLASLPRLGRAGVVRRATLTALAERYQQELSIKAPSLEADVKTLSGGNQQKVVVAKWLAAGTRILSIEEPTAGVDVVAKAQIRRLLREFAARGGAVLVASTDVPELLLLCDRIVVFQHGEVAAVLSTEESDQADVMLAGVSDSEGIDRQPHE